MKTHAFHHQSCSEVNLAFTMVERTGGNCSTSLISKMNLWKGVSPLSVQGKTAASVNSCFENNTEVCLLSGLIKQRDSHLKM